MKFVFFPLGTRKITFFSEILKIKGAKAKVLPATSSDDFAVEIRNKEQVYNFS